MAFKLLVVAMWDLVPWSGIEPGPSAMGAWCLRHWITRKVSLLSFDFAYLVFCQAHFFFSVMQSIVSIFSFDCREKQMILTVNIGGNRYIHNLAAHL